MKQNITIIGDGGWGTALGTVLERNGHQVTLWGPFAETIADIRREGVNSRYLPGIELSARLHWTSNDTAAVERAGTVVLAIPSRFYEAVCERFKHSVPRDADIVSVTKGLCSETHDRMSTLAASLFDRTNVAVLSGPSHAEEVARRIPTAVVAASKDIGQAMRVQELFNNPRFRVYTSQDPVGVELGGALKNVIALAVGISDGLGFGDNTRAALITRGLSEMTRLGCAMGALPETFAGLSGMGDLIVTCTSRHSRNRGVGERLGSGETLKDILRGMQMEVEGVWNCATALTVAREHAISVPITEQVVAVVHEGRKPIDAVSALMERDAKPETSIDIRQ